ncbi:MULTISPECIES: FKBP-type peptidyl-prolyl cis-trans isomerase [Sphingomonas]|jgi:FKBP-type peptidyl-prolyl cis-trans isomerase FkpA|uniref:FKBP-type peptidyl-prolyl cis-trans isomerase n=1 Tax=Sphingomonas TaxID=13687 RepID=UPI00082CF890|nr:MULTISPECIES: FKBP-type peptidyl-prolyl cis-trans isomerase [Sphingomonas]MBY0301119.1 FKBP-type peptidyl-prolyl cis-trans isomerase [Sphingomonas ginsenosidimutans]
MSTVTAVPLQPVKRAYVLWLVVGLVLAAIAGVALARAGDTGIVSTSSGLRYKVVVPGDVTGAKPTDADVALINYEGKLMDGTTFDKSQQPTPLPVAGAVPGFSEGLKLMHKGAKYRFWIPPNLGYGAKANGPIPANSTLVFDVELQDFIPEATLRQLQMQQQMMGGMPPRGAPGAPGAGAPPAGN